MENQVKIEQDCKMGMKAFQNLNAAVLGFEKLIQLEKVADPILLASTFYWATVRYSKPFLGSQTRSGNIVYPIKRLKNLTGFSLSIHEHILKVRNTLIAHDDFTEIEPRLLAFGLNLVEEDIMIPTSIAISNKCISFPSSIKTVVEMKAHSESCRDGVYQKLLNDIGTYREQLLSAPLSTHTPKYKNNYGEGKIEVTGSKLIPPDFMNDQWLNSPVPDYSVLHSGYEYEEAKIKRDFFGPEKITTPKGNVIDITPND